ncbi:MAG: lipopolysaccharide core heptose(II) kinase RfaY [Fusobacteriaceae bacterium]
MYLQEEDKKYIYLYEDGFEKFKNIFINLLDDKIEKLELQRSKYSIVYKLEINGTNYILKNFLDNPKEKNIRYIKKKIFKTSAKRIFLKTKELERKGYKNLCTCYFVAEQKKNKKIKNFLIMKYIVGVEVDTIKEKSNFLKRKLYLALRELHNYGIVSGDPNPTNFIINEKNEMKLIDINAKKASFIKIVKDIERFNKNFETQFGDDFWFWRYYKKYKSFMKK